MSLYKEHRYVKHISSELAKSVAELVTTDL